MSFASRSTGSTHRLEVLLPPSYGSDPSRRYPVLYLQDGQNLFDPRAMHGGWRADEGMGLAVGAGKAREAILVGVHCGPRRTTSYTSSFDREEGCGGGAGRYLRFLVDVRRCYIPKADGRKRPLGIPTVRDHVVQAATKLVLEPIFEADFLDSSYGFRPGRGATQALEKLRVEGSHGGNHVLDADIRDFFGSIDHELLLKRVAWRVSDRRVLKLVRQWLQAGVMEEGREMAMLSGTPQGGVISPLLSNSYLSYLDERWERQCKQLGVLVRYADDFVVLCRTRKDCDLATGVWRRGDFTALAGELGIPDVGEPEGSYRHTPARSACGRYGLDTDETPFIERLIVAEGSALDRFFGEASSSCGRGLISQAEVEAGRTVKLGRVSFTLRSEEPPVADQGSFLAFALAGDRWRVLQEVVVRDGRRVLARVGVEVLLGAFSADGRALWAATSDYLIGIELDGGGRPSATVTARLPLAPILARAVAP